MKFTEEQKRIAKLIGIKNLDSQNDLNRIASAQQTAKLLGIRNFDSAKDASQVQRAQTAASELGIRNIDSAKDLAQMRQQASFYDPKEHLTRPPFDYEGAMADAQHKFEVDNSGNEKDYAADFASLEDRLREMQNRPNTDPLERARVMGVRFAGMRNKLDKKKKNPFAVKRDPKMGIRSQAINI